MLKSVIFNGLINHQPKTIATNSNFAAVTVLLHIAENNNSSDILLIKRASHPLDPWSGQIGLPGGRHEEIDADLLETAVRETKEETGIVLAQKQLACQLHDQQGYNRAGIIDLTVRPFVFVVSQKPEIQVNYELDRFYWLPLRHFQESTNHVILNPMTNLPSRPGVVIDEASILWGMTYRIFTDFFSATDMQAPFIGD